MRGHFQIRRLALHHLHRLAAQESGDHHLIEIGRQRQNRRIHGGRIGADGHGDVHPFRLSRGACSAAIMFGALLMRLPVHAGGAVVENLHAVASAVALAGVGIVRKHHRQRDEPAAVLRPAIQDRKVVEREIVAADHVLARPGRNDLRKERASSASFGSIFSLPMQAFRHAHLEEFRDAPGDLIGRRLRARSPFARVLAKALISTGMSEPFGFLEQQRGAAGLHAAVGELGDLEMRDRLQRRCASARRCFSSARTKSRRSA